jgi:hypothetical protein
MLAKIFRWYAYFMIALAILFLVARIWFRTNSGYVARDGKVYFRSFDNLHWRFDAQAVPDANPAGIRTVESSGQQYGTDGTLVFHGSASITGADPSSFQVLSWQRHYSRDAHSIYWRSIKITDDVDRWQMLPQGYSKDSRYVYYGKSIVEGADPHTFVVTGENTSRAEDKNYRYNMGKRIPSQGN